MPTRVEVRLGWIRGEFLARVDPIELLLARNLNLVTGAFELLIFAIWYSKRSIRIMLQLCSIPGSQYKATGHVMYRQSLLATIHHPTPTEAA